MGGGCGIRKGGLADIHHHNFDRAKPNSAVKSILQSVNETANEIEQAQASLNLTSSVELLHILNRQKREHNLMNESCTVIFICYCLGRTTIL